MSKEKKENNEEADILKELKEAVQSAFKGDEEVNKEVEKMFEKVQELQEDPEIFKVAVNSADALRTTENKMKEIGREVSVLNLANTMLGTLLMFEKEGLVKILRNRKKK